MICKRKTKLKYCGILLESRFQYALHKVSAFGMVCCTVVLTVDMHLIDGGGAFWREDRQGLLSLSG